MPKISAVGQAAAEIANRRLGLLLKELRDDHGFTQGDIARALRVNEITVSRWERGVGGPMKTRLAALAELLGVSESGLMDRALEREGMLISWSQFVEARDGAYAVMQARVENGDTAPLPLPEQVRIVEVRNDQPPEYSIRKGDVLLLAAETQHHLNHVYLIERPDGILCSAHIMVDDGAIIMRCSSGDHATYPFGSTDVQILGRLLSYCTGTWRAEQ